MDCSVDRLKIFLINNSFLIDNSSLYLISSDGQVIKISENPRRLLDFNEYYSDLLNKSKQYYQDQLNDIHDDNIIYNACIDELEVIYNLFPIVVDIPNENIITRKDVI